MNDSLPGNKLFLLLFDMGSSTTDKLNAGKDRFPGRSFLLNISAEVYSFWEENRSENK